MRETASLDPQTFLPAELRRTWAVTPREALYWLFIAGALLGAGAALSVVGWTLGVEVLRWAFPGALLLAIAGKTHYSRIERKRLNAIRRWD